MTAEELIAFEADVAETFNRGEIRAPVHLAGGNEAQLLTLAREFKGGDYFFSTWRSHYHALVAGVPPEKVRAAIMAGRSITLAWPEHRFLASAIVAGCCPIAVGVAWQIKRTHGKERVWCFLGDMAASTGLAHECFKYADAFDLPIRWVVEINGKSVCTDTRKTWNGFADYLMMPPQKTTFYHYDLSWPHSGVGQRINF